MKNVLRNNINSLCCSLILATSMTSKLGCWLCITSCRRVVIDDCGVISGPRVGTLLARCSCFLEQTLDARMVATECIVLESAGFVLVLLVIAGVDDLEEENFLRFFLRAAKAGPRPWLNMWCVSWWCAWEWEWWECCVLCTSWLAISKEDFESDEPSDRDPPSSDAGEYTESSERDLPGKRKKQHLLIIINWFDYYHSILH